MSYTWYLVIVWSWLLCLLSLCITGDPANTKLTLNSICSTSATVNNTRCIITCDRIETAGDWAAGLRDIRTGSPGEAIVMETSSSPAANSGNRGDCVGSDAAPCC